MAEQLHACGRSALKAKGTEMACRCLKSTPAQYPLGTGFELATEISTTMAEDMQINPISSPLFWLQQLQTNFLQRGKKKEFSWTPRFSFSKAAVFLLGWEKSSGEDQQGPPTSMLIPEQLLKAVPPTSSQPLICHRLVLPLKANTVLPKGTALDIQLANMQRRWPAWGRQGGWNCLPHGEGALPMHPVPAQEEITHPAATRGLAHALKLGRRLQLLTGHPGCCFQKAPDTTGSHMPDRQVTL